MYHSTMLGTSLIILFITSIAASQALPMDTDFSEKMKTRRNHKPYALINGTDTTITKHPYQAAIFFYLDQQAIFLHNGVILDKKWILTIPFLSNEIKNFTISAGETYIGDMKNGNHIEKVFFHPKYDTGMAYFFSLLKLNKPLKFSKKVKKIKIAKSSPEAGSTAVISGWGTQNGLQDGSLTILSREECKTAYLSSVFTDNSFCASNEATSPYESDEGAPVVKNKELYGIFQKLLHYPPLCKVDDCPSLYTDVTKPEIKNWILDTIKHN